MQGSKYCLQVSNRNNFLKTLKILRYRINSFCFQNHCPFIRCSLLWSVFSKWLFTCKVMRKWGNVQWSDSSFFPLLSYLRPHPCVGVCVRVCLPTVHTDVQICVNLFVQVGFWMCCPDEPGYFWPNIHIYGLWHNMISLMLRMFSAIIFL